MPRRLPSESEILGMKKVSQFGSRNPDARQTFLHRKLFVTRKYSIDKPERQTELLSFSNAISPKARIQRVINVEGRIAEETYHHGLPVGFGKLSQRQLSIIGRTLAHINATSIAGVKRKPLPVLSQVDRLLSEPELSPRLTPQEKTLVRSFFSEREVKEPKVALCHTDVHSDNVIRGVRGLKLIDIGDMKPEFVGYELARAISGLCKNETQVRALLKAYESAGGDVQAYTSHRRFWDAYERLRRLRSRARRIIQSKDPAETLKEEQIYGRIKTRLFKIITT